jgi:hypothetical protein
MFKEQFYFLVREFVSFFLKKTFLVNFFILRFYFLFNQSNCDIFTIDGNFFLIKFLLNYKYFFQQQKNIYIIFENKNHELFMKLINIINIFIRKKEKIVARFPNQYWLSFLVDLIFRKKNKIGKKFQKTNINPFFFDVLKEYISTVYFTKFQKVKFLKVNLFNQKINFTFNLKFNPFLKFSFVSYFFLNLKLFFFCKQIRKK